MQLSCSLSLHYRIGHTYTHKPTHTNKTIYTNKRPRVYNYTHTNTYPHRYSHIHTPPPFFLCALKLSENWKAQYMWPQDGCIRGHTSQSVCVSHRKVAGMYNTYYCTYISKTGLAHYPLCVNTVVCFKSRQNRHFKFQMMLNIHIK